jgi:replicative superfamily II helicase
MKLRMKVPVQIEPRGKWLPAGTVLDIEHDEAMKLIARNTATAVDGGDPFPSDDAGPVSRLTDVEMDEAIEELTQVKYINKKNVRAVIEAGYKNIEELQAATEEQIAAIPGIVAKHAKTIVTDAAEFVITDD